MRPAVALSLFLCLSARAAYEPVVAIVANLSGGNRVNSEWIDKGIRLAERELSRRRPGAVRFTYFDDQGTIEGSRRVAEALKRLPNLKIVIAGYSSKTAIPLAQQLLHTPILQIFASSTQAVQNPAQHVALVGDNQAQGQALRDFVRTRLKAEHLCLLIEADDGFSAEIRQGLETALNSPGTLKVFSYIGSTYEPLRAALEGCYQSHPQAIIDAGGSTNARLLLQEHLRRHPEVPIVGTDGWGDFLLLLSPENAKLLARGPGRAYLAYYWSEHAENARQRLYWKAFQAMHHNTPDTISSLGHDAAVLAATFIEKGQGRELRAFLSSRAAPVVPLLLTGDEKHLRVPAAPRIYRILPSRRLEAVPKL